MSENFTKEGIEVRPGQIWRDLDKRMPGRKVKVWRVVDGHAACFVLVNGQSGKITTLAVRRMHKHSTGWELVQDGAESAGGGNG